MRRFVFSRSLFGAAVILVLSSFSLTSAVAQTEEADTTAADTTVTGESEEDKTSGRVRISIDESGISIEGRAKVSETEEPEAEGDWVEVYDERRRYKEKGLDIVKFRESVFVTKDELVRGDLVVFGGNAMIEGRVGGNVVVIGGNIRARSGAVIKGDAVVIGGTLDEDDDVIIAGERVTLNNFLPAPSFWLFGHDTNWFKLVMVPVGLFIQLILAFLVLLFLRDRIVRSDEHLSDSYLKSFGIGLLSTFIAFFGLVIVSLTLLITIIGIPLAILLWISCAGIMVFAWTVFTFSLGKLVAKRLQIQSDNAFLMVFVGAIVINLPSIIAWGFGMTFLSFFSPLAVVFGVLGWFVRAFAYLSGFGALILSRFGSRPFAVSPAAPPAPHIADAG
jgi:hypothetical protein